MKRLVPAPQKLMPNFDPVVDFPADIDRLVAIATYAGYTVTPRDVAELWRRHASDVRASWFAVDGDDPDILVALLKHAEIQLDAADKPSPPAGYPSWLDFAVDTMDTRAEEQERLIGGTSVSRQSMRDAVKGELVALRRKAGEI